ncbi:MAG TPA: hypothetical protein VN944_00755 [Nitrospiria bacterium]|nr:hypothetical protein [Nitrospiria bacterium]
MIYLPPKKNSVFAAFVAVFITVFFFQGLAFIFSNEINGIHIGKRRARLSPPVKQSVSLQLKYTSMEDISVEGQSSGTDYPKLKFNGFSRRPTIENNAGNFSLLKEEQRFSSAPRLFTLYRTLRI